ncbi:MAG: Xaa-Pro peptidase family protein [Spirochaetaceae bacterium]|jgi:Xaa-Pro dipeptidase|nr:Xaa-Pro peptidase family protein [Spirochaetaceae bacterium]
MNVYEERRDKVYTWMAEEGITLVMFQHTEDQRDPAIRWMTGFPGEALLFLVCEEKKCMLVPWDLNLAKVFAHADVLSPYNDFDRQPLKAITGAALYFGLPLGTKLEIPPATPYPVFLHYVEAILNFDVICRSGGVHEEVEALRAVKDAEEIGVYRQVSAITNELIELLEKQVRAGKLKTEGETALFIESECRKRGCEGTGFETLAAGPGRSFGIHPFPAYTMGDFAAQGLSILDFGVVYLGYTSDVTLTFAREPLTKPQERLISLTERAYRIALSFVQDGMPTKRIAAEVDTFFNNAKKKMPHALGHGIGLEAHEFPALRNRADNAWTLKPGMVFTLEPGLYDPLHGGCRLENDILLTEAGAEILTNARIIRL